jgi:hypothetical protein
MEALMRIGLVFLGGVKLLVQFIPAGRGIPRPVMREPSG